MPSFLDLVSIVKPMIKLLRKKKQKKESFLSQKNAYLFVKMVLSKEITQELLYIHKFLLLKFP